MKKQGMMLRAGLLAAAITISTPAGVMAAETKASSEAAIESSENGEESSTAEAESTAAEEESTAAEAESTAADSTRAAEVEAPVGKTELADGDYMVEATLEGGSGRATITSPTGIRVKGGTAIAAVQFSSPNYDYMIVGGKKYKKLNSEGDSIFNIPIMAFNEPFPVIADTTAMSKPHEIEYTLTFHTDTAQKVEKKEESSFGPYIFGAGIVAFMILFQKYQNKKKK